MGVMWTKIFYFIPKSDEGLAQRHFSRVLFERPPRWMCKQRRLCSGSRCCEHLLEGTAALANTEQLFVQSQEVYANKLLWRGPHKKGSSLWADYISQLTYTNAVTRPEPIYMQADALRKKVYDPWLELIDETLKNINALPGFTKSTSMSCCS